MRAEGNVRESAELLHDTWNRFLRAVLGDDTTQTLRCANSLAISLRKSGALDEAMHLARDTYERYLRRHDQEVPDALRCALNLAAAYAAVGDNDRARELAAKTRAAYDSSLGDSHPTHWPPRTTWPSTSATQENSRRLCKWPHLHSRSCAARSAMIIRSPWYPRSTWPRASVKRVICQGRSHWNAILPRA